MNTNILRLKNNQRRVVARVISKVRRLEIISVENQEFLQNEKTQESVVNNGKDDKKVVSPSQLQGKPKFPYKDMNPGNEDAKAQ